ncbi:acyl carrier protein [Myxococcaceae bacterium GXIMD 01537]
MTRQQLLEEVRNLILAQNSCLFPDEVGESASLTYDLGMDSLHLEQLISGIKEQIVELEFTPWYIRAARHGQDTVGGLVDYIDERQALAPARSVRPALAVSSEVGCAPAPVLEAEQA